MKNSVEQSTALIMAGGTGGHIFPGIAVAQALSERGWSVKWLGAKNGMEEALVRDASIEIHLISISGLRGNGIAGWLKLPFNLFNAIRQSIKVVREIQPNIIIGFGGFVSGPGGIAAKLTRTPLVIHEQNAVAGLTNRVLASWSKKIFQAFPSAFKKSNKVETVGNPLRQDFVNLNQQINKSISAGNKLNVLVVGGSRGALALNKYLPKTLSQLLKQEQIRVTHQVGKNRLIETQNIYASFGIQTNQNFELVEFIGDMAASFAWADILICRAGASTVSEVAAAGVCAIFVPYPYAVDDHQTANAHWLVDNDAAICVAETMLEDNEFDSLFKTIIKSPEKITQLADKAKSLAYLHAAEDVAIYCDQYKVKAA